MHENSDKTLKKALAPRLQPNSGTSDAGKNLFTGLEKKDLNDMCKDSWEWKKAEIKRIKYDEY